MRLCSVAGCARHLRVRPRLCEKSVRKNFFRMFFGERTLPVVGSMSLVKSKVTPSLSRRQRKKVSEDSRRGMETRVVVFPFVLINVDTRLIIYEIHDAAHIGVLGVKADEPFECLDDLTLFVLGVNVLHLDKKLAVKKTEVADLLLSVVSDGLRIPSQSGQLWFYYGVEEVMAVIFRLKVDGPARASIASLTKVGWFAQHSSRYVGNHRGGFTDCVADIGQNGKPLLLGAPCQSMPA